MSDPQPFLESFEEILTTVATYGGGHPARRRAEETAHERLSDLLEDNESPVFLFGDEGVRYDGEPVEVEFHPWGRRLSNAGVERLEFREGLERDELEGFVDDVAARLNVFTLDAGEAEVNHSENIRFGPEAAFDDEAELPDRTGRLEEEIELVGWIREQARERNVVPAEPLRAVTRSLWSSLRGDRIRLHMIRRQQVEDYDTTHALNVSVLSMGLARYSDFPTRDILRLGEAALTHDIGKVTIPDRILTKPGKLTKSEWRLVRGHPVKGARMLVRSDADLDLAAVVAYEHHITKDGGYPKPRHAKRVHAATRLIQICDVYDAFSSQRSFRGAWPKDRTLEYLRGRAGSHFDPGFVSSFCRMVEDWKHRLVQLDPDGEDEPAATSRPSGNGRGFG